MHRVVAGLFSLAILTSLFTAGTASTVWADDSPSSTTDAKSVVFIAGKPSHGYGQHEHHAGCLLLADHLRRAYPDWKISVLRMGGPPEWDVALRDADAVVMYSDGGAGHPALPHMQAVDALARRGGGIACLHYAVEVPRGDAGVAMQRWIGGYFETHWSVNPHWKAEFKELGDHPVLNGVSPFAIQDEWYFNMRFRDGFRGVTPILSAVAPETTMKRSDGPHSGNPHVRRMVAQGEPQHVAWVSETELGSRGFGFTGGHFHWNWGNDDFRRVVLNAIVWIAHGHVPAEGVTTDGVSRKQLEANQDEPAPTNSP